MVQATEYLAEGGSIVKISKRKLWDGSGIAGVWHAISIVVVIVEADREVGKSLMGTDRLSCLLVLTLEPGTKALHMYMLTGSFAAAR